MKIDKMDICDTSTLAFKLLQQMTDVANEIEKKAKRLHELNRCLVYNIQNGYINDTDDILCAQAWYEHSNLDPSDIMRIVRGEVTPEEMEDI